MAADASLGLMIDRRALSACGPSPFGLEVVAPLDRGACDPEIFVWLVRVNSGGSLPGKAEAGLLGTHVRLMDRIYLPKVSDPGLVGTMFDCVADIYDDLATLAVNVDTARALLDAALENTSPNPIVLDFGCGTGLAAMALDTSGRKASLLGVDLSSAMLLRAAARGETVTTIDEWRRSPPPVNAAIAAFVLHYGVPAEDLDRIAGSLSPGGRFAANLFRPESGDVERLARTLAPKRMELLVTAEIRGTKAPNVLVAFQKRR